MTILPQLVNISPKKVMFTPKYVDLRALSSVVASRIYALFVVKSTRVPRYTDDHLKYTNDNLKYTDDKLISLKVWGLRCDEVVKVQTVVWWPLNEWGIERWSGISYSSYHP